MCGRYSRATRKEDLLRRFRIERVETDLFGPRYNIAPSQESLVVVLEEGQRVMKAMRWGLVPSWAKDPSPGPINARSETLSQKPMFRGLLKGKRCLVPADGFYEWKKAPGQKAKIPYRITLKGGKPFVFAGLWDAWKGLSTFVILTAAPNRVVAGIHDRMPVILLGEKEQDRWLKEGLLPDGEIQGSGEDEIVAFQVSTLVNSPGNDQPECLAPAGA